MGHPHVSISYAHGDDDQVVERLVKRLIREGVECSVDFFDEAPPQGWPRKMETMMTEGVVLLIASQSYLRRYQGLEETGRGSGATFEANLLAQRVVEMQGWNDHVIPVVLREQDVQFIPAFLKNVTYYNVESENGYTKLYLRLTDQTRILKPALGEIRRIEPRELGTVETSKYAEEISADRAFAYSQSGILIHSYVCTFNLAVYPVEYHDRRYVRDDLPDLLARAKLRTQQMFPIARNAELRRLGDGYQAVTQHQHYNKMEFREYVRIRRNGLFTLTFVSPDDIGEGRQYVGLERRIGFAALIEVLTNLARLASGFVHEFGVESAAELRVCGLGTHRLYNDTTDPTIATADLEADEDIVSESLCGNAETFRREADDLAARVAAEALALLNFPYADSLTKAKVRAFQGRLY